MPYNAADLLAAADHTVVDTIGNIPRLRTRNTAHIIAHVAVADASIVFAVTNHTCRCARNAADIRCRCRGFGIGDGFHSNVGKLHTVLLRCGIHFGTIHTAAHHTVVDPCNTAHKMYTTHGAPNGTIFNNARHRIHTCNAAYTVTATDVAVKAAVDDLSSVHTCNAADIGTAANRRNIRLQVQIFHNSSFRQITKQPLLRAFTIKLQPRNGMPISFKCARKIRNSGKLRFTQIDILGKNNRQAKAVSIQSAIFRKHQQLVCSGNRQDFCFIRLCSENGSPDTYKKQYRKQYAKPSFKHLPPLLPL